uniref:Uncharacterized protein n=1 Tax=Salix viminalis TaxID=40686 RepID=A0A6N2LJS8_SALVM
MEVLAKNLVVVALVMAFALVSKPIAARGQATLCGMTAEGFDFCKPSVQTGVNPLPPSQSCCSALEKANLGCLCFFKKNYPKVLSENKIDPNLAMQLPAKCNMPGASLISRAGLFNLLLSSVRVSSLISRAVSSLLPSAPLLLFSLVPSSPTSSLLFVVAGLLQMACESHEYNGGDPFSSTPSQPSLSTSPSPKKNPKENDQCFTCKRLGNWSTDCPYKTPPKSLASSPGSSSSPSVQGPYLPVVRCPCGTCKGGCGFFEWSDDIVARFKPPMCPCDAGTCSLNIVSSGPDSGRWYFACRITKGHGACNFFQWADSEGNNMKNVQGDESRGYPAPRSLFPGNQDLIVNNEPCKQDNQSSDIEFESAMAGIVENYANTSMASPIRKDEVLGRDLVMQNPESRDHDVGTALQVAPLISKPEIPCQEPELSLQISAARHTKSEEFNQQKISILGSLFLPFSSKKTGESSEVMACESHDCNGGDPFSSTPSQPSLKKTISTSPSPQKNPKENDQCFTCKRLGHWAIDCPNKTPQKSLASSPGSSSSPSVQAPYLPVVRCPCGTCKVLTSSTIKNPGRKFYSCPVDYRTRARCGFFQWSDDIVARFKPPRCPCGAGTCSLNVVSTGPESGRWYYACRIPKGLGACNFFQLADSEGNNMKNVQGDESTGYPARRSLFPGNQDLI